MNKRSKTAVWLPIVATLLFCVLAILSGRLQKQEAIGNVVSEQMTFPNGTDVSLSAGDAYGLMESEGPGFNLPGGKISHSLGGGKRRRRGAACALRQRNGHRTEHLCPACGEGEGEY